MIDEVPMDDRIYLVGLMPTGREVPLGHVHKGDFKDICRTVATVFMEGTDGYIPTSHGIYKVKDFAGIIKSC